MMNWSEQVWVLSRQILKRINLPNIHEALANILSESEIRNRPVLWIFRFYIFTVFWNLKEFSSKFDFESQWLSKRWLHFGFESASNNEKLMAFFMNPVSIQSVFKLSIDLETNQNLFLQPGDKNRNSSTNICGAPRNPDSCPPNALAIRV